jgi:hypothetical protein
MVVVLLVLLLLLEDDISQLISRHFHRPLHDVRVS